MTDNAPVFIGHYRMGKTLGIGAFGKVKLGEHVVTGTKVAVKILNKGKIQAMEMDEKVRREINILKVCKHPHIIRLYEVIDTPTDIFVVMEYAPSGELFDYIVSKGRPSPDEAQRLFSQLISAIEYCHHHHIVHRDLKPENLLLDKDSNLKIADFGLSNMMRDGEFLRTSCGSPNYAAPEVINGALYAGPEVDVWSCGVILYALLCGSLPFDDESIPALFKKIKSGMYSLPAHLSPLTRDLIPRMLVVDPMKRITIPEIRQHPWFVHNLPQYLTLSPPQMEAQEGRVDDEVLDAMCKLPLKGITRQKVLAAVVHKRQGPQWHDLRVAYELILGNKHTKERLQDCVAVAKRMHETPPAFTPSRRVASPGGYSSRGGGQHNNDVAAEAARILAIRQGGGSPNPQRPTGSSPHPPPHPGAQSGGAHQHTTLAQQSQAQTAASMLGGHSQQMLANAKRRRWYLGIQSKKEPAHVMTEVYKALLSLGCQWCGKGYRISCMWRPNAGLREMAAAGHAPVKTAWGQGRQQSGLKGKHTDTALNDHNYRVVVGLTLYKVQQNIYLLDFQRKEGDQFTFMTLCAKIITQLKTLSAQSKAQAMQIPMSSHGGTQMPLSMVTRDPQTMQQLHPHTMMTPQPYGMHYQVPHMYQGARDGGYQVPHLVQHEM